MTLLELATMLAIAGILGLAGRSLGDQARKGAWRVRAQVALDRIYRTEILHSAVHGQYTADFSALHEIGLPDPIDPIYRFALDVPERASFLCQAWANLDPDYGVDSLEVDQSGIVRSLSRD